MLDHPVIDGPDLIKFV